MNPSLLENIITQALNEDKAHQDITTKTLISPRQISKAYIIFKEAGVICGLDIVKKVFQKLDQNIKFTTKFKDGQKVKQNTKIAFLEGKTQALLSGERVALNFLSHLSGIATLTNQFVQKISPSKAKILDTRKTTPLLRKLEKYAVRCGGGENHRFNLADMVLVKDNHLAACKKIPLSKIIPAIRKRFSKKIEIEVCNFQQFKEILPQKPDIILLDNMTPAEVQKIMKYLKKFKRRPLIEVSGGINLDNIKKMAQTGVSQISIGSLTHSAKAINLSLEIIS